VHNTREEGIMNDITFTASRLAAYRAEELVRVTERRRLAAERAACALPPVREHPRVRFPRLRFPHLPRVGGLRPAI
jgi:hypothetical protein